MKNSFEFRVFSFEKIKPEAQDHKIRFLLGIEMIFLNYEN